MPDRPRAASAESAPSVRPRPSAARQFRTGVARAFGGAIIFSLPLLMTMEMWHFGFVIDPLRLATLLLLTLPLLVGLSARSGFRETVDLKEDVVDACVAYAVAAAASAAILLLLGIIGPGMSPDEVTGKIVLQTVPASIGALLAQSQFGHTGDDERARQPRRPAAYGGRSSSWAWARSSSASTSLPPRRWC